MKQAVIDALTLEQRYDELPKELARVLDKYLKGTGVCGAEVMLKLPKLDDNGKPMKETQKGTIPNSVKSSLGRLVDTLDTKTAEQTLDMLENIATNHPAFKDGKDKDTEAKVKRMFEIRRELNAIEKKGEALIEELQAL